MVDQKSVVWVVQDNGNDYSRAELYGEVRFITKSDLSPLTGTKTNSFVFSDIRKFKSLYVAGTDFIVLVGNPMVVASVVMAVGSGIHRMLKWDGRMGDYIMYTLDSKDV